MLGKRALRFGIIGVGGYIAPRHLQAIKDIGSELVCAYDVRDCVGVMDRYFPEAEFFTKEREFRAFLAGLNAAGAGLDFISICSPNFMHFRHIALALEHGASAICEKPLVLSLRHARALQNLESRAQNLAKSRTRKNLKSRQVDSRRAESGVDSRTLESRALDSRALPRVYGILQLRLHEQIIALRQNIQRQQSESGIAESRFYDLRLRYISARGKWYLKSWKGDMKKSGGIVCNIGVHLFDMLVFVFGRVRSSQLESFTPTRASGVLELEHARVRWLLSIDASDLDSRAESGSISKPALRVLESALESTSAESKTSTTFAPFAPVEFSQGFEHLHSASYEQIARGQGFGLSTLMPAIELIEHITKQGQNLPASTPQS